MFCKIIDGSESAQIVYKDDNVIAFFPRTMNVKGHMIIAPVQHFTDFFDIQENVLSLSMDKIKFLSNLCQQQLGAEGVNLLHANGEIYQPVHENGWCWVGAQNADSINPLSIDFQSSVRRLQMVAHQQLAAHSRETKACFSHRTAARY